MRPHADTLHFSLNLFAEVALTFDDGPYIYESTVANNFGGDNKATFFLNGASEWL